ncbi:SET and MYND domain-containing protein 4-like [Cotesia glomerata]|uniref:Protein-lysine N-methyltransferase SMYD4 n=1 Tax=Cotesia glomerata TaxID=32391 RepID=A0AAV7I2V6_COTGL|nr:SET and MYND domain-containing protein 4-like [Cotesia glomerata]KAH0541192.1 hypothetical protein KQX54_021245 [Cotesia glomerata]
MDLESLKRSLDNCTVKDFSEINFKDESEMMSYVLHVVKLDESIVRYTTKSNEEANKFLAEAKEQINKKMSPWYSVIEIYTKAMAYAEPNSPELAKAYANRSATFCNECLYEDCLLDVAKALALGYPDELKAKLYFRRVKALWGVEQTVRPELEDAISQTRKWIEKLSKESEKATIKRLLKNFKKYSYKPFDKNTICSTNYLPKTPKSNPLIKGASDAIKLNYSEIYGRHFLATKDIKVGEVILVQKAYASVHNRDYMYSYCWNCSQKTYSSIPCKKCTNVIFCNEACREAAWNKFHDIECEILASLPMNKFAWFDVMSVQLTIKAIKEAGSLESLKKLVDEIKSSPDKNDFEKEVNHKSYSTIYNLYNDLKFMQKSNLHKDYPVRSAHLLSVFASKTQLLINNGNDDLLRDLVNNQLAVFLGGLILKHMNISSLNTFEGVIVKDKTKYKRSKLLGSIVSYFNHSCDDNISYNQCADKLIFRASRNIKKDEQLFITYGPLFQTNPIKERREKLESQYNFKCNCIPCSKNWAPDLVTSSWMDQALLIDRRYRVMAVYQKYSHFFKAATEKEIDDKMNFDPAFIPVLLDIINILCENVNYPCIELISSKAALSHNYISTGY